MCAVIDYIAPSPGLITYLSCDQIMYDITLHVDHSVLLFTRAGYIKTVCFSGRLTRILDTRMRVVWTIVTDS